MGQCRERAIAKYYERYLNYIICRVLNLCIGMLRRVIDLFSKRKYYYLAKISRYKEASINLPVELTQNSDYSTHEDTAFGEDIGSRLLVCYDDEVHDAKTGSPSNQKPTQPQQHPSTSAIKPKPASTRPP